MPRADWMYAWRWHFTWAGVFAANSVVPLWLGWYVTGHGGRVGMLAATAMTLATGLVVVPRWSGLRTTLVAGGAFTAITQVFPVVQLTAGVISLGVVDRLGFEPEEGLGNRSSLTEAGGFFAALLTAGVMLGAALACGVAIRATGRAVDRQIERKLRERVG